MKVGFSSFNARAEKVDTAPAFRGAWKAGRRCLIVTQGFYEWRKADKQPFAVALGNKGADGHGRPLRQLEGSGGKLDQKLHDHTTDANALVAPVHDRMPAVLGADDFAPWLGEEKVAPEALKAMLRPYPPERMMLWPVDKRVGNVNNEGPELAEPVALSQ